ncbi:hypothetical protein K458DRAFT_312424 [Lentithecium fluviatile CBS 122367]|uniref:Uncharacterized protein n=1 Tax=Lentithecium fluviatile CBS 122367 TaxID=1168545 RepID=A0A6G1IPT8_9PLEO|nr:hypothetical protein K458DRAFT_312424 [Lentithecium fluviatile CBS 122367]
MATRIGPGIAFAGRSTSHFWQHRAWPAFLKSRPTKKQICAIILISIFGIVPFFIYGRYQAEGNIFFYGAFLAKVRACEGGFGVPQNSTVSGAESLFVLDNSFGRFTFAQAKAIDVGWDILVGRGAQLCAWYVTYKVFSDALIRLLERHPAPFEMFKRIGLEGASLNSAWALLKELFTGQSKRTWALFFYMLLSTLYVLSIPAFLSAMTGYDSRTIPWISIGDDENNIVPASYFERGNAVVGTWDETFIQPTCEVSDQINTWWDIRQELQGHCHCQLPNGTKLDHMQYAQLAWYISSNYTKRDCGSHSRYRRIMADGLGRFNYTGNTETYMNPDPRLGSQNCTCNRTMEFNIGGNKYYAWNLNITHAYCWQGRGYDVIKTIESTRCLPDTANPSYQWGFSSMLVAVFLIIQFGWSLTMYIVWQDAQINSRIVKSGFRLTELGVAFVVTEAAKRDTGLEGKELVRADGRVLERELCGTWKKRGAVVEKDIFGEEGLASRKRTGMESEDEREV